jgi:hypothetical protein
MSILAVISLNADFDGDSLNLALCLDNDMAEMMYPLSVKFNALQFDEPYKVSKNVYIPKPAIASISSWLSKN